MYERTYIWNGWFKDSICGWVSYHQASQVFRMCMNLEKKRFGYFSYLNGIELLLDVSNIYFCLFSQFRYLLMKICHANTSISLALDWNHLHTSHLSGSGISTVSRDRDQTNISPSLSFMFQVWHDRTESSIFSLGATIGERCNYRWKN